MFLPLCVRYEAKGFDEFKDAQQVSALARSPVGRAARPQAVLTFCQNAASQPVPDRADPDFVRQLPAGLLTGISRFPGLQDQAVTA